MYPFEPYANASRHVVDEDPQPGFFDSVTSTALEFSANDTVAALESALLCDEQRGGHMPNGSVAEALFEEQSVFPSTDEYNYGLRMETVQYHQPHMPASSFDSGVSDSTFASSNTMTSSVEEGEDSVENLDNIIPDLWAPELLPSMCDDHIFMNGASAYCQAHESMSVPIENDGNVSNMERRVTDLDVDELLPAVSRSARTWARLVRLVCNCNRLNPKTLKEVSKKRISGKRRRCDVISDKQPCEIRISKKIPRDGRYLKEKAWLGTYATPAQRGRALDVGKYFLCTKKKKTFSDPESEGKLSAFDYLRELSLAELVESVTKLAKYYGVNGSLPPSLDSL